MIFVYSYIQYPKKESLFTKKCSMKKLASVISFVLLLTLFFACQKTQDAVPTVNTEEEILSCAGGGSTPPPPLECGQFRTQSQGGWGTSPYGNNAGAYLRSHFSAAFPAGMTIGCDGHGYSVYFSSAKAITEFLPASGTASVLTINAADPRARSIRNVLVGHVTALALNIGFDSFDWDFSPADEQLGNLQILSGPFAGKSVSEFLSIANGVLGGCNTEYSVDVVNQTASAINANFLDGRTNGGFLGCPVTRLER